MMNETMQKRQKPRMTPMTTAERVMLGAMLVLFVALIVSIG